MTLVYIGTSLKNARFNPLAGALSFCSSSELKDAKVSHDEFPVLLDNLTNLDFVREVTLISTCNRFEIYLYINLANAAEQMEIIKERITEVNKSQTPLASLLGYDAEMHFIRTFCGLNSGLLGEKEITQQIQISFMQSIAMGYMNSCGMELLKTAQQLRAFMDREIYPNPVSYCDVALKKSLEKYNLSQQDSVTILGSGSTAFQAATSLIDMQVPASKMQLLHRISSSSDQVAQFKKHEILNEMSFTRTKHGYHADKSRDIIFSSDLVVFGIDSKNPVVTIPANSSSIYVDFNSRPSASLDQGFNASNYISSEKLEDFVREHTDTMLQDSSFLAKLINAENYIYNSLSQKKVALVS